MIFNYDFSLISHLFYFILNFNFPTNQSMRIIDSSNLNIHIFFIINLTNIFFNYYL